MMTTKDRMLAHTFLLLCLHINSRWVRFSKWRVFLDIHITDPETNNLKKIISKSSYNEILYDFEEKNKDFKAMLINHKKLLISLLDNAPNYLVVGCIIQKRRDSNK